MLAILLATAGLSAQAAGRATDQRQTGAPDCASLANESESAGGVGLIVMVNDRVICRQFAAGFDPHEAVLLWSGSKSFTGIVAAAAVKDRLLRLDEPVAQTITEWQSDPVKSRITIRQLLSLTSGIATPPSSPVPPSFAEAIAVSMRAAPGQSFTYGPAAFQIFGALIDRKLAAAGNRETFEGYLDRRVLAPAGIPAPRYMRANGGADPNLPGGARMSPDAWAAFGSLVLHGMRTAKGVLVDPNAFQQLFEGSTANPAYGLGWWLVSHKGAIGGDGTVREPLAPAAIPDLYMAIGAVGQRLYMSPSQALVAVRVTRGTRAGFRPELWSDRQFIADLLRMVAQRGAGQ